MDLFNAIESRASYRGPYKSDPVPREALLKIMRAGAAAPSGCNAQTTSFVAVDDSETLKAIGAIHKKPSFASAPAAICVFTEAVPVYAGNIYNVQDYAAAIENMLLAITAMGYASCWVEGYVTMGNVGEKIAALLGAPKGKHMVCFLPVGAPKAEISHPQKKPLDERAWFGVYGGTAK